VYFETGPPTSGGRKLDPQDALEVELRDGRAFQGALFQELHLLSEAKVEVVWARYEAHSVVDGQSSKDGDADSSQQK